MGRPRLTQPLDIRVVKDAFAVTPEGAIVRSSTGEAATFRGPAGKLMVRVYHDGKISRIAAARIAWCLAAGEWPSGVVRARNGVDDDLSFDNLIATMRGPRPFTMGAGGKASSLERRSAADRAMLAALAEHQGSLTVPQISRLVGSSAPCVCARLGKLSDIGLTCGPKCDARARWDLTPAGKALAAAEKRNAGIREHLAQMALVFWLRFDFPAVNLWVRGNREARVSFEDVGADITPYPFLHIFPQDEPPASCPSTVRGPCAGSRRELQ